MNRERAKELLPIIKAYANGEDIQIKLSDGWTTWESYSFTGTTEYRIKPKPREWIVFVIESGSIHSIIGTDETEKENIRVREILDE